MDPKTIDLIFLLYIAFSIGWGYFAGAVSEFFSFAGLLIVLAVSMKTYDRVAVVLSGKFGMPNIEAYIVAFIIVFLAIYIALKIVQKMIEKSVARSEVMTQANKSAGMLLGFAKGSLICLVIGCTLLFLPLDAKTQANLMGSNIIKISKLLQPYVVSLFGDKQIFEAAAKINEDPKGASAKMANSPEFQKIIAHPKVQELASDPDIKAAVEKNDFMALMQNKRFLEFLNDKEMLELIRTVDFQKLLSGAQPGGKGGERGSSVDMNKLMEFQKKIGAGQQAPSGASRSSGNAGTGAKNTR